MGVLGSFLGFRRICEFFVVGGDGVVFFWFELLLVSLIFLWVTGGDKRDRGVVVVNQLSILCYF